VVTAAAPRRLASIGFAGSPCFTRALIRALGEKDLNPFLTDLAVGENVAASTQNQVLAAVLFVYEHVPEQPLDRIEAVAQAPDAPLQT
jgi:hypothetical protein